MEAADVRGLLGTILTDGAIFDYRSPTGGFVQLTLTAGLDGIAFLEEKVAEIGYFFTTEARIIPYLTPARSNGARTPMFRFRLSTNRLRPLYNLLYPNRVRQITATALEMLGGHAAGWTWANGAIPCDEGQTILGKVGKSEQEARLISEWLEMLTGAPSKIYYEKNYSFPRLFFEADESKKIRDALYAYAPTTRRHLFEDYIPDVSAIRSTRTELLLGEGEIGPEGDDPSALAGDPEI